MPERAIHTTESTKRAKGWGRRSYRSWAVAAVGVLLATACGSTARQASAPSDPGFGEPAGREFESDRPGDSGGMRDDVEGGSDRSAALTAPDALRSAGASDTAGSEAGSGSGVEARGGATPGRLPVGPGARGVTEDTIQIGISYTPTEGASTLVGGATGTEVEYDEDRDKMTRAAVEFVNSLGGIAGRTIEPVIHEYDLAAFFTKSGRQREAQRACAMWTEDNHVFAIASVNISDEIMLECAARTKTPMVDPRVPSYPSKARFGSMADYWYSPYGFVADRRERSMGQFLLRHGFFGKDAKVGLMIENKPGVREGVDRGLKPVLAEAGLEPVVEIVYSDIIESPWPNYVLQLQTAGVTHVIFSGTEGAGFPPLFTMRAAEQQRYRPKWGLGTDHWPAALITTADTPREQLKGVLGMGWWPVMDTAEQTPQSGNAAACLQYQEQHGSPESRQNVWWACEPLLFLRAAFERAEVVSPAGLADGVGQLADSYPSTITVGGATRFGAGRHDGVTLVRAFAYDHGADQFRYISEPERLPDS